MERKVNRKENGYRGVRNLFSCFGERIGLCFGIPGNLPGIYLFRIIFVMLVISSNPYCIEKMDDIIN